MLGCKGLICLSFSLGALPPRTHSYEPIFVFYTDWSYALYPLTPVEGCLFGNVGLISLVLSSLGLFFWSQLIKLLTFQSLLLVYAQLIQTQLLPVINFLSSVPGPKGESALHFVMTEWVSRQTMFYGNYESKV